MRQNPRMSVPIHVESHSGYKANERPRQFVLDDEIYEIAAVLDQWYEPSAMYFKVQSIEGKTYLLRYDEQNDEWSLQSGFDGNELLVRPNIELVTIDYILEPGETPNWGMKFSRNTCRTGVDCPT